MVVGMLSQIVCGNLTGMIKVYEFHVLFRWLSACTCALMYTSGQMICKFLLPIFAMHDAAMTVH